MKNLLILSLALILFQPRAYAQCADDHGDMNGDGALNVFDTLCVANLVLGTLLGDPGLAECANGGSASGDLNCDGFVNIADSAIAVANALEATLPIQVDATSNGCPTACDGPPLEIGALLPQWELEDHQPASPLYEQVYGPKDMPGVRVIALLDGG